jgi:two-component system, OmpR family, phosphate regulon sensor histidine kinase PhoR
MVNRGYSCRIRRLVLPPMRVALALFLTILAAFAAFGTGAGLTLTILIVALGAVIVGIMSAFSETAPMPVRTVDPNNGNDDAALIDGVSEPLLLVVDGRVRIANAAARSLLGAHIIGEDVRLAIRHPAAAERLAAGAPDGSTDLAGLGGRDQHYDLHVATIRKGTRLVHLIDRTGRYAVERARVDFVANASHELRTPLAAILGFVETLSDEKAGSDPAIRARFLAVMDTEARRMQRLIDDLISLSRIEAEKYALPETLVALPSLVVRVAEEIRIGRGESVAPINLEIDEIVPDVAGEDTQLSQVLHNLIGNAIKYGRDGAPVKVSLKRMGANVRLSITDQGDGIAAEHIPRLTERFYRVDAGRSRGLGGTGLGLAIVKHIVERHRGRLEITSRIGIGTTVSVIIPAAAVATVTQTSPN